MNDIVELVEHSTSSTPFDVERCVAFQPHVFGALGSGSTIGRWARYLGGDVTTDTDNRAVVTLQPAIGLVVGDRFGRIVLWAEGSYFIGWLRSNDYEFIDILPETYSKWMH